MSCLVLSSLSQFLPEHLFSLYTVQEFCNNIMVKLGVFFINLARQGLKKQGLARQPTYYSPAHNAGIWHGSGIKHGHVETFSGKKSKRTWKPNVFPRTLYSDLLDENVSTTFSMKAVREVDRAGGFDNYILNTPDRVLKSNFAIQLKRKMETVQRMLDYGDKTLAEIKKEIEPRKIGKHEWIPREHTNRYYFDWKGPRRHMVFC